MHDRCCAAGYEYKPVRNSYCSCCAMGLSSNPIDMNLMQFNGTEILRTYHMNMNVTLSFHSIDFFNDLIWGLKNYMHLWSYFEKRLLCSFEDVEN